MQPFTRLESVAAVFPLINTDTDRIIPKQFLKTIKRTGLGAHLFHELRYHEDGSLREDFVLNRAPWNEAQILIAGDNFGCGSSREHAVWALLDFGIRCVIAPGFADIFYANCFKNGILPICLAQERVDRLADQARHGANAVIRIDLPSQRIVAPEGETMDFALDPYRKTCLLEGLDDIAQTLREQARIDAFEARRKATRPWL